MLTLECPHCKRSLHPPAEGGDLRVVCPGCDVVFALVIDRGSVRAVSESVVDELPLPKPDDDPPPQIEKRAPSSWLAPIFPHVTIDEAARRTRRLNWTFAIATALTFGFLYLNGGLENEMGRFSGTHLAIGAFISVLTGGLLMIFVGLFLFPVETYQKRQEILNRLDEFESFAFHAHPEWVRETPESIDSDVPPTSEPQPDRPT